jgi:hypothetical protein
MNLVELVCWQARAVIYPTIFRNDDEGNTCFQNVRKRSIRLQDVTMFYAEDGSMKSLRIFGNQQIT